MKRKKTVAGIVILVIIALIAMWSVLAFWPAEVEIRCSRDQEGRLIVDLKPNFRVNGLYWIDFWMESDDEYLWALNDKDEVRRIVYGEIPPEATQKHPTNGVSPKQLPNRGILYVRVKYQYDIPPAAACVANSVIGVELTEDGGLRRLGDAELKKRITYPKNPNAPADSLPAPEESY